MGVVRGVLAEPRDLVGEGRPNPGRSRGLATSELEPDDPLPLAPGRDLPGGGNRAADDVPRDLPGPAEFAFDRVWRQP